MIINSVILINDRIGVTYLHKKKHKIVSYVFFVDYKIFGISQLEYLAVRICFGNFVEYTLAFLTFLKEYVYIYIIRIEC